MCIFCRIINKEIPSHVIYEDDDFVAILDISQATKGHALLIPKIHYENIYDLDDLIASKIMVIAKKIANKLNTKLKIDGINILQNNGIYAGQSVMHYHIHLIPRYINDDFVIKFTDHGPQSILLDIKKIINSK